MTANVETLMYSGEVPWHGVGTAVPADVTAEEAIRLAGLDWDVEVVPIVSDDERRTGIDRYRMTRRVTDDAVLGIVRKGWQPIQNRNAFRMFDGTVGEGRPIYHTAGSLQGGSKVFIAVRLPGTMSIVGGQGPADHVDRYLLLSNSHDGTRPLQMLFTPIRVVCSNTLSMALYESNDDEVTRIAPRITIRHNLKADKRMKEAERTMGAALRYYEKFGDFAGWLRSHQLAVQMVDGIVGTVFPPNRRHEVTPAMAAHRGEVVRLFDEGMGHNAIAGSAWALLNAFVEYADHGYAAKSAKEPEDRSYSVLMGGARGLKQRAVKVVYDAVAA